MTFLLSYLFFYHWSFEILYLSPLVVYPLIMMRTGIGLRIKLSNHLILLYLLIVVSISIFRQMQIGTIIPREFVIFAIQAFSYFIGYRVLFKYYDRRDAEIKKFKIILCIISIFIFFTAVTNIISGAKYSHGFNIFGVEFLFSPEWPLFSMLCIGAVCVIFRSKIFQFVYFVVVFWAASSRAAILIYALLLLRSSTVLLRLTIMLLFVSSVYLILHYNSYLLSRFLEIGSQLQFSDASSYVEELTQKGLVNPHLYREENLSTTLSTCTRIGDLGRIGNTIFGVATALPFMGLGTGFTLMNMEILCLDRGYYHPAGPAWNPIVYSFIQGGVVGGTFLMFSIYRLFYAIEKKDTLFYLIVILFIASMITKGLSSYVFWTVLGMLSGYSAHAR